jgi:cellulose synthase/poly-beta-1,6-N-acetylglucosamine synthase-like glycosyltransferase
MVANVALNKTWIGWLLKRGYITQSQLAYALFIQGVNHQPLEHILIAEALINENHLLNFIVKALKYELVEEEFLKLTVVDIHRMEEYVLHKFLLCKDITGNSFIFVKSLNVEFLTYLTTQFSSITHKIIIAQNFEEFFKENCSKYCLQKSIMQFDFHAPHLSTRKLQVRPKLVGIISFLACLLLLQKNIFYLLLYFFSIVSSIFKFILCLQSFRNNDYSENTIIEPNFNYPLYSILIPLYKESSKVVSIIKAMERLDYPKDRLEVKILAEEDDSLTLQAISAISMPSFMEVIKVPACQPRTKPKALNYGLQFIKGKYVVVYDAEDIPDKMQLKKVCNLFNVLPEEYVCLQARLTFYNVQENLLTRFFTMEYYVWFNFLLPGLDKLGMPVPLGGTSNHFKVSFLKKSYGWDPYNVTEDAEIGIRLHGQGFKTKILNSVTFEESLIDIDAWLYQRARWIKGFINTYFAYKRNLINQSNKFTLTGKLSINIFLGLSVLNFVTFPVLCLAPLMIEESGILILLRNINIILYLGYCYLTAVSAMIKLQKRFFSFTLKDIIVIIGWPFYFVLHSFASWRSIYELFVKPYEWNKTSHGISKLEMNLND